MTKVSVNEKKEFLRWFCNHYNLKRRESVWILNYIMSHDEVLKNTHFVEGASKTPRGFLMSTFCIDKIPFRFFKENLMTTDAEKGFHDIRLNKHEPIYIQLEFSGKMKSPQYLGILEENPYDMSVTIVEQEDKSEVGRLLTHILHKGQKGRILAQIDRAIDEGNKEEFMRLSEIYKGMEK